MSTWEILSNPGNEKISIIFAYRNREISRIKAVMDSLHKQKESSFEFIV